MTKLDISSFRKKDSFLKLWNNLWNATVHSKVLKRASKAKGMHSLNNESVDCIIVLFLNIIIKRFSILYLYTFYMYVCIYIFVYNLNLETLMLSTKLSLSFPKDKRCCRMDLLRQESRMYPRRRKERERLLCISWKGAKMSLYVVKVRKTEIYTININKGIVQQNKTNHV